MLPIVLPPLRDRADDIPLLVDFYVDAYNAEFKKRVRGVAPDAMKRLQAYGWPGNIRELRNAVERAMLLAEGDTLTADDFTIGGAGAVHLGDRVELPAAGIDLEQLERSLVVQALERTGWNQTRAAALLGLNRDQIRYRIEKFHLEKIAQLSLTSAGILPHRCGIIRALAAPSVPPKSRQISGKPSPPPGTSVALSVTEGCQWFPESASRAS